MTEAIFLTEKETTSQIKILFQKAQQIKCAVAFWGGNSAETLELLQLRKPIQIICNFESGATNPKVIRQLRQSKHIQVRSHPRLHATVYWTEQGAIVGSSNASANGLSFEGAELTGWLEANISTANQAILKKIESWFDHLWQQAEPVTDAKIEAMEEEWRKRRHHRPKLVKTVGPSLLAALKEDRESFKDRNIVIGIYRYSLSEAALKTLDSWQEQNVGSLTSEVGCYEDWPDLPVDTVMIDIYYGPRGGFDYHGLWYLPEEPIELSVVHPDGSEGQITLCFRQKSVLDLTITDEDEKILKNKVKDLYHSTKPIEHTVVIPLHEAWRILFNETEVEESSPKTQ